MPIPFDIARFACSNTCTQRDQCARHAEPGDASRQHYIDASVLLVEGKPCALLIDNRRKNESP